MASALFNPTSDGNLSSTDNHPNVIDRLQFFEDNPASLENQRSRRYNDDPPPYSASTTEPATPNRPPSPKTIRGHSLPYWQFKHQSRREEDHLIRQSESRGRKQTLPFDPELDFWANAENNIRSDWMKQGIWKGQWGPAWPKGATPSDNTWLWSSKNSGRPEPLGVWGHEKEPVSLAPAPKPESRPLSEPFIDIFSSRWAREHPKVAQQETAAAGLGTSNPESELNVSASRPINQFRNQVIKEMEWLTDEPKYKGCPVDEIEAHAYRNIKSAWSAWKIWNPEWGPIPGPAWLHENAERGPETYDGETTNTNGFGIEQGHPTSPSHLLNPQPCPNNDATENNNNNLPDPVARDGPAANAGRLRGQRRGRRPAIPKVPQQEEQPTMATGRVTRSKHALQNAKVVIAGQKQTAPVRKGARNPPQSEAYNPEQNKRTKRKRGREPKTTEIVPERSKAKRTKLSAPESHDPPPRQTRTRRGA